MKKILSLLKSYREKADHGDAVLVTTLISIPLLCLCFAFATGISMATWQKTSYNSAAQAAATASLQKVKSDGYLGQQTMQGFVSEYLSQTGRSTALTLKGGTKAAGQGTGSGETGVFQSDGCSTGMINGVERQLPYIEVELDINRSLDESTISTYPYWSEGTSGVLNAPEGGHGTIVAGQQYRVINAKVWEASKNVTWFGVSAKTPTDMTCQPYSVSVSAILFGNNEDLSAGEQCFQPDMFPVSPSVVKQINVNNTAQYKSPLTTCQAAPTLLKLNQPVEVLGTYRTWSYVETIGSKPNKGWVPTSRLSDLSTWTITYDLKGGTPDSTLPTSYSWKDSRDPITIPNASKQYYNFGGWQQVNCSTKEPSPSQTPTVPTKIAYGSYLNLCFDAVFTIKQFAVTWNANGGPGGVPKTLYDYGSTISVPANPVRPGYTSNGWFTSATQPTGKVTTSTVTVGAADTVYYQQYTANSNVITIDANGGTGGSASPAFYTISPNAQTITLTQPTRPGYSASVTPWTVTSGTATVNGNILTIPANTYTPITVKMNWAASSSTITVDSNGGSGGAASPKEYTISGAAKDIALTVPTRNGYTLSGWTITTNTGGGIAFVSGNTLKIPANAYGPITVRADWSANSYTVSFNCNGRGSCPASTTYTYGVQKNVGSPSGGGTFDGWTLNDNNRSNMKSGSTVIPTTQTGNVTLYAHWTWNYTATYDPGGSWASQCRVGGSNYWGCSGWAGCSNGDWAHDYGWVYFTMDNKGRGYDGGGGFGRQVDPGTMGGNGGNGLYYTVRANVTDWPTCAGNRSASN